MRSLSERVSIVWDDDHMRINVDGRQVSRIRYDDWESEVPEAIEHNIMAVVGALEPKKALREPAIQSGQIVTGADGPYWLYN